MSSCPHCGVKTEENDEYCGMCNMPQYNSQDSAKINEETQRLIDIGKAEEAAAKAANQTKEAQRQIEIEKAKEEAAQEKIKAQALRVQKVIGNANSLMTVLSCPFTPDMDNCKGKSCVHFVSSGYFEGKAFPGPSCALWRKEIYINTFTEDSE